MDLLNIHAAQLDTLALHADNSDGCYGDGIFAVLDHRQGVRDGQPTAIIPFVTIIDDDEAVVRFIAAARKLYGDAYAADLKQRIDIAPDEENDRALYLLNVVITGA
ncbi:hypothetical protein [Microbispora sp. NPDC049125]|uniref:hypothetical protein n=1 Tax=Microbispora sp. NPDC049125 TaxID=3154929 RepID=UPI003465EA27